MPRLDYNKKLELDNAAAAKRSRADRDIFGSWPAAGDADRREACAGDFLRFCETYFPQAFCLPWSDDHRRVIATMQTAVLGGGLFCLAMPRGSGKSTLCERLALWALVYGHRRFVTVIAATEKRAGETLRHLKSELTLNDLLAADFRHVCHPLRSLGGITRRAAGQLCRGEPTMISWCADRLTLPVVAGDLCDGPNVSGACVTACGLTGSIRGQSATLPNGQVIRPELVILDDPQTRESAQSVQQSAERSAIVGGDVLGMAGPGRKIAAVMPCTVIREGDVADTLLNRKLSPQWQGEKCKMLYGFPVAEKLWEKYAQIRADEQRRGGNGTEAAAFYKANQKAMDEGAVVAWSARFNGDEVSAIQNAMNLKLDDEQAFFAEYQNEPMKREGGEVLVMTPTEIASKVNAIKRGELPVAAERVTAFIDVHDALLFWVVCGWGEGFTGWLCDYGTWPDQNRRYFSMRKATRTLGGTYGGGREGSIRAGLDELTADLLSREWMREDGTPMRIERLMVDSGYVPDVVEDVCRRSPHAALLMPSRGIGISAAGRPMGEYSKAGGDRIGFNWYVPKTTDRRALRRFCFDSNFWKSFVHAQLAGALGDRGSLTLFGSSPDVHKLLSEHLTAETPVRTQGRGRTLDEWRVRPDRQDNHWFDCLVGCAAAASFAGLSMTGEAAPPPAKKRIKLSELQAKRRGERGHAWAR